jgi:hypothetical protein
MWPDRATIPGNDGKPKFHRFYLLGTGKTFGVFLHHFVESDAPRQFHDHPWSWGISLILRGHYLEERRRRDQSTIVRRYLKPGRINLLLPGMFHRVELCDGRPVWTLFIHGPKIREWGFLDAVTGSFRFWQKDQGPV